MLILATFSCYLFLQTQIDGMAFGGQGDLSSIDIIVISFLISVLIAIIAVIAGVGGGGIFTPLLLAFTSFDTLVIRSTGLVVAMFSGLISTGPLMRKGLADIKLVLLGALPIIVGGMSGSFTAIFLAQRLGAQSDGIIRLLLGLMLLFIAAVFVLKSSASDYPVRKKSERFSQFLKLRKTYWESSLGSYISYRATNVKISIFLFLAIVGLADAAEVGAYDPGSAHAEGATAVVTYQADYIFWTAN